MNVKSLLNKIESRSNTEYIAESNKAYSTSTYITFNELSALDRAGLTRHHEGSFLWGTKLVKVQELGKNGKGKIVYFENYANCDEFVADYETYLENAMPLADIGLKVMTFESFIKKSYGDKLPSVK